MEEKDERFVYKNYVLVLTMRGSDYTYSKNLMSGIINLPNNRYEAYKEFLEDFQRVKQSKNIKWSSVDAISVGASKDGLNSEELERLKLVTY